MADCPHPGELLKIAREERARRKAAWDRAGRADSTPAREDEIIWSNIEHFARVLTGSRQRPINWHPDDKAMMADNIRATLSKAPPQSLAKAGWRTGLRGLQYALEYTLLYTRQHPVPAQPAGAIFGAAA